MKKVFTKVLIIAIISAILSMLICVWAINGTEIMGPAEELVEGIEDIDKDSVTAGYEVLGRLAGGRMYAFVSAIIIVLVCLITGSMFGIIIILQIIARLVQIGTEKSWKNTTSKVCTYVSAAIYIMLCLIFLIGLLMNVFSYKILLVLALDIYCVVTFFKMLSEKNVLSEEQYGKNEEDITVL